MSSQRVQKFFGDHTKKVAFGLMIATVVSFLFAYLFLDQDLSAAGREFARDVTSEASSLGKTESSDGHVQFALTIEKRFTDAVFAIQHETFAYDVFIHLTIAFLVAAILILAIERQIRIFNQAERMQFADELRLNVWRAIFNRRVPNEITEQIEAVLQFDYVKKDVFYTITLDDVPGRLGGRFQGEEAKWLLLGRQLRFSVENISGIDGVAYPFKSKILTTADKQIAVDIRPNAHGFPVGEHLTFPRHAFFSVRGETVELKNREEVLLEHPIKLGRAESCEIVHTTYELLRVNDEAYYVQQTPIVGLDVVVSNRVPHRILVEEVFLAHPQRSAFIPKPTHGHDQRWVFERKSLLPGQMFSVRWKETKDAVTPQSQDLAVLGSTNT